MVCYDWSLLNHLRNLVLAASALALAVPASASRIDFTFDFSGVCTDCNQSTHAPATATLVLNGNYVIGATIVAADFVTFTYNGSDLLVPFTILPTDPGFFVTGAIPNDLPGTANITVDNGTWGFNSISGGGSDGSWSVVNTSLGDFGTAHTWSSTAVPEPATVALLGLGLASVAFLGRRAHRK